MRKILTLTLISALVFLSCGTAAQAQNPDSAMQYRRSSLYSFMISHPDLKMDDEIVGAFMAIETPDKYNNHDLSVKCVTAASKGDDLTRQIENWFERNDVAKRLVSKWFLRSKETGGFDPSLVMERGLYGASAMDVETAAQSKRGIDALADKGYEMISNTFVIVNDITYVDHEKNADVATAEENLADRNHILEDKKGELNEIVSETKQDEEKLREQAKKLEGKIEPRLLTAFKRIRKNARNGLGIVYIQRDACGGCFNRIPPQRQMEIKMHKKVIVCEYCGRILIDPELAGVKVGEEAATK